MLTLDQNQLKAFSPTDAAIAELKSQYMSLRVEGIEDKKGLAAVREARLEVKRYRVDVEKKRKELKADALEYGRKVDAEAKRITALLTPIEEHLQAEEDTVANELARIKKEKEEAEAKKLEDRITSLAKVKAEYALILIRSWTDEEYEEHLAKATAEYEAEQQRLAEAEAEKKRLEAEAEAQRKAESERLAKERAELERQRAEMEAERKEQERIAKEKRDAEEAELRRQREEIEAERKRQEQVRLEQERKDREAQIAENARLEAERKQVEAEQAEKKRQQEDADRKAREEALKPDKAKLAAFASQLMSLECPKLSGDMSFVEITVKEIVDEAASKIMGLI